MWETYRKVQSEWEIFVRPQLPVTSALRARGGPVQVRTIGDSSSRVVSGWPDKPSDRGPFAGQLGRRRAADGGAAEDAVAVVEDGGLASGYAAGGMVQADAQGLIVRGVAVQPGHAGVH